MSTGQCASPKRRSFMILANLSASCYTDSSMHMGTNKSNTHAAPVETRPLDCAAFSRGADSRAQGPPWR
jgi:hypothetical protein